MVINICILINFLKYLLIFLIDKSKEHNYYICMNTYKSVCYEKIFISNFYIYFCIPILCFSQAPTNLAVNNVFNTSATVLSWQQGSCAQLAYTLSYKDSLQSNWDSVVVTNNGNNFQAHRIQV